jgi:hypothetical protein
MMSERRSAGWWVVGALCALILAGCGGGHGKPKADGGDAAMPSDAREGGVTPRDGGADGGSADGGDGGVSACVIGDAPRANGEACECAGQCGSNFCVEGVCCDGACGEACKTCTAPDRVGVCVSRSPGAAPRVASACPVSAPASCGLDGTCDGAGGCRKYGHDTQCMGGSCDGQQVVGGYGCNGSGQCKPGATIICAPFMCDPATGRCLSSCTATEGQCTSNHECVNGSCGPKMNGAACAADGECKSTHCADGVCCNVACNGACNSCNLPQREGTCWPIDRGVPDPRGRCKDNGPTSCGSNGLCDGLGTCAKYPRDTICVMPACSGTGSRLNTAGTCDGVGACRAPNVQECHPFRCVNGACTTACTTDADCDDGIACVQGTCGPKQNGQSCAADGECKSGHCVDKVCCASSCEGACRSCALPGSPGTCTTIAAGSDDTRGICVKTDPSTCGTNGKCEGTGACQRWAPGTTCADESCAGGVYTPLSTCNATGVCVTPDQQPCSPFLCNGNKCFTACTDNNQCLTPNSCQVNSCGKKPDGANCSAADECINGHCEQGICCGTACVGPCRSCALSDSRGTCTNVPTGALDPAEMCGPDAASTCGRNGRCEGGACQRYAPGTACKDPTCAAGTTTFTGVSGCDGAGTCVTPGTTSCFPFLCGAGACKGTCSGDADCASPAVCINGSCGLKPNGAVCVGGQECVSQICEQGVCCATSCGGTCKSCALPNARGTCTNVASGDIDPHGQCTNLLPASCMTDGFCDGAGACRLYDASTTCAAPSCPASQSTLTSGRTCDGRGTCQAPSSIPCAPYICNGTTACKAACAGDNDCLPGNICDLATNRCGNKKRLGQACSSTNDCLTGNTCVDGVCCSTNSCPLCQACNVTGSAGNCANLPINTPAPTGCAPNPPCGNTGTCNGLGGCQQAGTGVSCGTATCSGSTYTPISHCNGSGACAAPTAQTCSPYLCGTGACKTACTGDGDCLAPYTCQGTTSKSCALKPNGQGFTAANQCISGNCLDAVCCGSASCPTCQACNVNGLGSCAALPAGTAAPAGQCTTAPPCGNTGTCNGAGACTQQAASVQCVAPTCSGSTFTSPAMCTGSGTCGGQTTSTCSPYVCASASACRTSCSSNSDCISTSYYCTGTGGSCQPKRNPGATCGGGNECTTGSCVDGVCCNSGSCGTCQACNLAGSPGTCANIPAGSGDLHGGCPTGGTCGNTGTCNGAGACAQAASSVACGGASCTGSTYTAPVNCTGTGSCPTQVQSSCAPYVCGTNACKTSCNSNGDCISASYYCTGVGGSCQLKKDNGQSCTTGNECSNGNCVDSVCCGTASCPSCQACNLNGVGTCSNVGSGAAEPHARCAPTTTCGNTGTCNGAGACTQAGTTVQCGSALCNGTAFTPAAFCNGSGACGMPATVACTPFVCGGSNACLTSCSGDGDCASGYYCPGTGGQCQSKKAAGAVCATGHECGTGNCVDGVCCNSASCGTCQSCGLTGDGNCATVVNGTVEPHNRCAASPPCGNTGVCQGGACQQAATSVVCGTASCASPLFQPTAYCNGVGGCATPASQNCSPLACNAAGCLVSCSGDGDCVGGTYCSGAGGSCQAKKANGQTCVSDNQCTDGHCLEGICCGSAACPACQSCAVPGNEGTCSSVAAGTPSAACHDDGAASCGNDGKCNGNGACELYPATTICSHACAADQSAYNVQFCDGMGICATTLSVPCPLLACDGTLGCL